MNTLSYTPTLKLNSHAQTFFVRLCEYEIDSFILFLKENFVYVHCLTKVLLKGLTNFRKALRTVI